MHHELHTEVTIDAPPEVVWDILTDLDRYEEWNPFIIAGEGTVVVGSTLELRMQNPGSKAVTMRPRVTEVETGQRFEWLGHLLVPGIFDGRHRFELTAADGGTKLVHREEFSGLAVRLFRSWLDDKTGKGFLAFNDALAARARAAVRA